MLITLISLYVVSDTSRSINIVGEDVRVEGIVDGDVSVVRGSLDVLGRVKGDADVVSGNLHLYKGSVVEGDVSVVGGDLILDSASVVEGDVALVAGSLENNGGTVKGEIQKVSGSVLNMIINGILNNTLGMVEERPSPSGWERRKRIPHMLTMPSALNDLLGLFLLLLVLSIFFLILKKFTLRLVETIERDLPRTVLFGILSYIIMIPVLLLLVVSVVGILLIPIYIIGLFIAFFVAINAGLIFVGRIIRRNLENEWNEWGDLLAGFAVAAALKLIGILLNLIPASICCLVGVFTSLYGVYMIAVSILGFGAIFKWIFRIE